MSLLQVSNLTKYYGAEFIFGDISFRVARGEKVALVGVNGAGKSTIMKIIAGVETPTSGGIHLARGMRVAYLPQEANFNTNRTLLEEIHASLADLNDLREELSRLEHALADTDAPDWEQRMERYGELLHRFEHAGGYEIERRIEMTLEGLGFTEAQYHQPVIQFSGGQKTRTALAIALLTDPDLLLLDEPSNHLDLAALEWLERFLNSWDGTLMVISHDRYFLDKVTKRTLDLAFGRLDGDYPAPYQKFLELKAERLELLTKQFQAQQEWVAKTEDFIRRFKNSQMSKQARGRERILERMKEGWEDYSGTVHRLMDRPEQQKKVHFRVETQTRGGDLVLRLDHLTIGYPNARPLLTCPNTVEIVRGQRVALMGPNGSGKTTMLRTLTGELAPLRGHVRLGHRVSISYYAQAHEALRPEALMLDEIRRIRPRITDGEARTLLGRFLFSGDDVFKRVGDLSGGERSRLALAQLTLLDGNLLVLDEPTNHLDIDSRESLETVLNEFNGTLLFVSHDRYFVDAVADTIWMVQDGKLDVFNGTYSEYVAERERRTQPVKPPEPPEPPKPVAPPKPAVKQPERQSPKPAAPVPVKPAKPAAPNDHLPRQSDRDELRESRRRQRRQEALEQEIAGLEADLKGIESEMNTAGQQGDGKRVTVLSMQYAEIQNMLARRYDEWAALAK